MIRGISNLNDMINKSKELKSVNPECPGAYSEGVKGGGRGSATMGTRKLPKSIDVTGLWAQYPPLKTPLARPKYIFKKC